MMRKIFAIVPIMLLGLFTVGGIAAAAPGDPGYPIPSAVTVTINVAGDVNGNINVIVGSTITFSGDGFDPLEGIGIDVATNPPSGLRNTSALARLTASSHSEDATDANGHFDHDITLDQVGTTTLTGTGHNSGKTESIIIHVLAVGQSAAAGTTTVAAGGGGGGGGSNAAAGSQDNGTGLARTGASIAGPLAIGFLALFAGLALLFLGTRGVRQRKSGRASE